MTKYFIFISFFTSAQCTVLHNMEQVSMAVQFFPILACCMASIQLNKNCLKLLPMFILFIYPNLQLISFGLYQHVTHHRTSPPEKSFSVTTMPCYIIILATGPWLGYSISLCSLSAINTDMHSKRHEKKVPQRFSTDAVHEVSSFITQAVMWDETQVEHSETESKQQFIEWCHMTSQRKKKFKNAMSHHGCSPLRQ